MWLITLRDLHWRRRRFTFGTGGTALVFAVTLLLAGLASALRAEADHVVGAVGADAWVVRAGASGPFSALTAMPEQTLETVAKAPGVRRADPLVMAFATTAGPRREDVTVVGYRPGGLGPPAPTEGRAPTRAGEALVDRSTGFRIGETFSLLAQPLTVVGTVRDMTLRGGVGNVYLPLRDAQAVLFKGNRIVTTIVTKGVPTQPEAVGLAAISPEDARVDLLRLFQKGLDAIEVLRALLWLVALAIVGTVVYLSVLDRVQDFAVLKAVGVSDRALMSSLAAQAVIISVTAAAAAVVLGRLLAPAFPMPINLGAASSVALLGIGVLVGLGASLGGLRRAVGVDPAVAFGQEG